MPLSPFFSIQTFMITSLTILVIGLLTSLTANPAASTSKNVQVAPPQLPSVEAEAFFERKTTPAGPVYLYNLRLKGTQSDFSGSLPQVDNLILKYRRTERNFKSINGKFQTEVTFIYLAHRLEDKDFIVPAFEVMVNSERVVVPQAKLLALPSEQQDAVRMVWLDWTLPQIPVYAGQGVPFEIRLYRRADVGLTANLAGPELKSEGLSLPVYAGPYTEEQVQIKDVTHSVYTWKGSVTALKSGTHRFQFSFPVVASLPSGRQDPFDLLMGSGFSRGETQELILQTPEQALTVAPLPESGRPEGFSGALGSFSFAAHMASQTLTLGEPVTLTLSIAGQGNLEQILPPDLKLGPAWKQYPPKETLETRDALHLEGKKTFEYILVPLDPAITALPALQWSFFDPQKGAYQQQRLEPMALTVSGAAAVPMARPLAPALGVTGAAEEAPPSAQPQPLPLMLTLGARSATLTPLFCRPGFYGVQGVLLLVWIGLYVRHLKKQRFLKNPRLVHKQKQQKELQRRQKELQQALEANDPAVFFLAACELLCSAVAAATGTQAKTLTLDDVRQHAEALSAEQQHTITLCFQQADHLKYGAAYMSKSKDLKKCYQELIAIIGKF